MRRRLGGALALLLLLGLLTALWALRPPPALAARFGAEDCARVRPADAATGRPLVGIEDMALSPDGDMLILSAADRRALERDADEASGGLYALSVAALLAGERRARPLLPGVFPHGIALSADGRRLAAILRSRGEGVSLVEGALGPEGFAAARRRGGAAFCRANDLVFAEDAPATLRVTLDRRDCGPSLADLRPGARTGRVLRVDMASDAPPAVERAGLAFANGLAGGWVAETRGARLAALAGDAVLALPGGPDNLTPAAGGALVAALHPSLLRFAAWRHGWRDAAPTRIVRIDAAGAVETLHDDPAGARLPGASVAILAGEVLVAGSPLAEGLLLCRTPAA